MRSDSAVILSLQAYLGIVAETYERVGTETGGMLLGHYRSGKWYVIEVLDPGPKSTFSPSFFEYDESYATHLSNKTARFYKQGLQLIGLWHRHPGSYSQFSSTDDGTNAKFAELRAEGAISMLVNLDPHFRLTAFRVTLPLEYQRVDYAIGNELFPPELLAKKGLDEFLPARTRLSQPTRLVEKTPTVSTPSMPSSKAKRKGFFGILPGKKRDNANKRILDKHLPAQIQPTLGSSSPPERETQSQAPSSGVGSILDQISVEIDYLDAQLDYSYSLKADGADIVATLDYAREMPYYPPRLQFIFGADSRGLYVKTSQGMFQYQAGFIRQYINEMVRLA